MGTERCEIDFPLEGGTAELGDTADELAEDEALPCETSSGRNQEFAYTGDDGVEAGGFIRRLAFALRFQDLNPIFSGLINDESKFIYNRDVRTRARELAPFLDFDADPYPPSSTAGLSSSSTPTPLPATTPTPSLPIAVRCQREAICEAGSTTCATR